MGLVENDGHKLPQAVFFAECLEDINLLMLVVELSFLLAANEPLLASGERNYDLVPHGANTLDELTEDDHLGFDAAQLGSKYGACLVENIVRDSKVLVRVVHTFTDVKWRAVQLPLEELKQLVLQNVHLLWILEFFVVAGEFLVSHDAI